MSTPAADDDRTVLASGAGPATVAMTTGPSDTGGDTHALPVGTRLNEFELTQRIGEGGFSIVYLAWDHSLDRRVALKEYMPGALASRVGETQIRPRSERHRETFDAGLKSFVNEAKLLARFDHPALVKVYRFWEANGTAYLVMPLYEGVTLKDTVRAMSEPPDEAWLMRLLTPLTAALGVIHAEQCYHRDIAPDNVMMLADGGRPLLLDFGAARRVIGDMTQALTVILKPGFAPVEQYAEVPGMKQGPWTDVYALAATVYWAISGKTPPPSVGRMLSDSYVPLAQVAAGRYSERFLRAIDAALVVLPDRRTPSIDALRRDLGIDGPGAGAVPTASRPVDPDATVIRLAEPQRTTAPASRVEPAPSARPAPAASATSPAPAPAPARAPAPAPVAQSRRAVIAAALLVVAGVGAAIAWWSSRPSVDNAAATAPAVSKPSSEAPALTQPAAAVQPDPAVPVPPSVAASAAERLQALELPEAPPTDTAPTPDAARPTVDQQAPRADAPVRARKAEAKPEARPEVKAEVRPETKSSAKGGADKGGEPAARSAECAQIYQRLSLGETRPDLLERARALKCQ